VTKVEEVTRGGRSSLFAVVRRRSAKSPHQPSDEHQGHNSNQRRVPRHPHEHEHGRNLPQSREPPNQPLFRQILLEARLPGKTDAVQDGKESSWLTTATA
jgi:hypothetical protein